MPFPASSRVVYKRNPLKQVICQLRFPPILRIASEPPARFQELIRQEYPLLRDQPSESKLSAGLPPELAQIVSLTMHSAMPVYDFLSADEVWTVGLTREFLSLSTTDYRRWAEFRRHLELPLSSLCQEYSPAFFSRIGLRYQDIIVRSDLGLGECDWSDLLQPHIAGELSSREVAREVDSASADVIIRLDEAGRVRIRHGVAVSSETREQCYLIDSDFYTEQRTEIENAYEVLERFKQHAARLFRWSITDRLHDAMGPEFIK
jgi:uncharacterized protein (TIGR04255 family)